MSKKKKMLFISSKKPFPIQDGAAIRTMQMYRMLSEFFDIDMVYCSNDKQACNVIPENTFNIKRCNSFYVPKWKSLIQTAIALFSKTPLQCAYFFSKKMDKFIKSRIDSYDYVFCNNLRTSIYVLKGAKCDRWIDFVDAISMNYNGAASKKHFPINLLYKEESRRLLNMEIRIASNFNKALIISDIDLGYINSHSANIADKIMVVPNSVEIPDESIHQYNNHNIVFVGSMFYEPNIIAVTTFAKKIFPLIVNKLPNAKFYIVGNRPADKVKKLASDNIIVTGFVNDPKEYLRRSNIVVAPMFSGAGVQNKILEAMSMGCCVVTTTIGAEGLGSISNGQEIIIKDNYGEMAFEIIRLLSNRQERQVIGARAKDYVMNNFSYNKVFQTFTERVINK